MRARSSGFAIWDGLRIRQVGTIDLLISEPNWSQIFFLLAAFAAKTISKHHP